MLLASLPSRGRPPLSSGLLFSGTHQFAEEMNVEFIGSQAEWANGSAIVACDSAAYDLRRIVRPGRPLSRSQSHKRVRSDVVFWINRIAEYLVGDGRHEGRPCPLVAPPCRTVEEAGCEILGLSKCSAYAAVNSGELPAIRIGRRWIVPRHALERILSG